MECVKCHKELGEGEGRYTLFSGCICLSCAELEARQINYEMQLKKISKLSTAIDEAYIKSLRNTMETCEKFNIPHSKNAIQLYKEAGLMGRS